MLIVFAGTWDADERTWAYALHSGAWGSILVIPHAPLGGHIPSPPKVFTKEFWVCRFVCIYQLNSPRQTFFILVLWLTNVSYPGGSKFHSILDILTFNVQTEKKGSRKPAAGSSVAFLRTWLTISKRLEPLNCPTAPAVWHLQISQYQQLIRAQQIRWESWVEPH